MGIVSDEVKYVQRRAEQLAIELVVERLTHRAPPEPDVLARTEPFDSDEDRQSYIRYYEGFWECLNLVSQQASDWADVV